MRLSTIAITIALVAGSGVPALAQDDFSHSVSTDLFASTDADSTDVYRAGVNLDLRYKSDEQLLGVRYEEAFYKPLGQRTRARERAFLRYADTGRDWAWASQIGTDGHTVLGSASIHNNAKFRQEFFVERDVVETVRGVDEGIYFTFFGAAMDVPIDKDNGMTLVGGVQEFTGNNVRLHARGTFTHSIKSDWGLSFQLRSRYYHSSHPREFDYYSPKYYLQVLPVLQMRRYSRGWRYMLAAGLGGQRDAVTDWTQSRFAAAEVTSPLRRGWFIKASAQYSNTPLRTGIYDYGQLTLALGKRF